MQRVQQRINTKVATKKKKKESTEKDNEEIKSNDEDKNLKYRNRRRWNPVLCCLVGFACALGVIAIFVAFLVFRNYRLDYYHDDDIKGITKGSAHYGSLKDIPPRPDEVPDIGDKSLHYRRLRAIYDEKFPPEGIKSRASFIRKLRKRDYKPILTEEDIGYDVFNCPDDPPHGYPFEYPVLDILSNWNPDDPTPNTKICQGICVFQYERDYDKAMRYREAEVPFVIRDDPEVLRTVERWSQPEYLKKVLGREPHRAEYSVNNHFMYWNRPRKRKGKPRVPKDWTAPTENIRMTYGEWLDKANVTDDSLLSPEMPHWYFRLIGCGLGLGDDCDLGHSEFVFDELPIFTPRSEETLYLTQPNQQKGIHCRFGMKGVIAENHFDGSRNMIALLGGERRYILSHPKECPLLALYPKGHPSARHSAVDWSDPDIDGYPKFADAKANEIVLQAGDVLYLPTYWFHYIISLEMNFQCNTRSGISSQYRRYIKDCGFM